MTHVELFIRILLVDRYHVPTHILRLAMRYGRRAPTRRGFKAHSSSGILVQRRRERRRATLSPRGTRNPALLVCTVFEVMKAFRAVTPAVAQANVRSDVTRFLAAHPDAQGREGILSL
jgi:hypothetical protein